MTERVQVLDILLDITRKGVRFYEQVAAKTGDRALSASFTRLSRAKVALLDNFGGAPVVAGTGAFTTPGSLSDTFRAFYEGIRAKVTAGDEEALDQLADREQRLMEAIQREALAQGQPLSTRAAAALVLPPLHAAIEGIKPVRAEQLEEQPVEVEQPKRNWNVA